eukprot:1211134-Amphidinium_carterae.1
MSSPPDGLLHHRDSPHQHQAQTIQLIHIKLKQEPVQLHQALVITSSSTSSSSLAQLIHIKFKLLADQIINIKMFSNIQIISIKLLLRPAHQIFNIKVISHIQIISITLLLRQVLLHWSFEIVDDCPVPPTGSKKNRP